MTSDYQINLSSGEIYVLAGLLHYHSVIGIENSTLHNWNADMERHVHNTAVRLERKKLILCELNGRILIEPHLHKIIECICNPSTVGIISGNVKTGKDSSMYILEKDNKIITLSQLDEDNYKVVLYSEYDIWNALSGYLQDIRDIDLHEKILIEDAELVQERIRGFQNDEAFAHLRKCVSSDDAAQCIYRFLSKTDGFIDIHFLLKRESIFETAMRTIISVGDGHAITVKLDENDVLSFLNLDTQAFQKKISDLFVKLTREG